MTPRNKRGLYLGLWNMSHNVGGAGAAGVGLCLVLTTYLMAT